MQERVGRLLAALLALFEVKSGIEIRVRIAALARPFLEVMDEWIDIALRDVRIGLYIMFGVEEAGFSYGFVIAEQPFHPGPCIASTATRTAQAGPGQIGSGIAGVGPLTPLRTARLGNPHHAEALNCMAPA